jgi:WD40 repeat protein
MKRSYLVCLSACIAAGVVRLALSGAPNRPDGLQMPSTEPGSINATRSAQATATTTPASSWGPADEISAQPADSDEIGQMLFNLWRDLAKKDGQEDVLSDPSGAVAACIPWDRVQRLPIGLTAYIDHWWHDSADTPDMNRRGVLERCENWKSGQDIDCVCHLIGDHLRPILKTPPAVAARINASSAAPVRVNPVIERGWLAEESTIPLLHTIEQLRLQQGMQATRYYLGMGKTLARTTDATPKSSPQLVVQQGHIESIDVGRWSHDGRLVATAGQDNRVLLWNAEDLRLLRDWRGHANSVDALAFDPDDRTVASGGGDGAVLVWDVLSGQRVATLFQRRGSVQNLSFSKNGELFASYDDNSVLQWTAPVSWLSRRGEWTFKEVLPGSRSPVVLRWQGEYRGEGDSIELRHQPGGGEKFEIVPSNGPPIRVFDPDTGSVRELAPPWSRLTGAMSPRSGVLAARRSYILFGAALIYPEGNKIRLSVDDGASVARVLDAPLGRTVEKMVFSPSGKLFAASAEADETKPEASQDRRRIRIWDLDAGGVPKTVNGRTVLAFSPDNRLLLGSAGENEVRIWDPQSGQVKRDSTSGGHKLAASAFSRDGNQLALAWSDGVIHVWDLRAGRRAQILTGHPGTIGVLTFDSSGRYIGAGGNSQRFLSVWDLKTGALVWAITPQPSKGDMGGPEISSIIFSGSSVAYGVGTGEKERVFFRGLRDGHLISAQRGGILLGPDGYKIIVEPFTGHHSDTRLRVDKNSARLRLRLQSPVKSEELQMPPNGIGSIEASVFSPDGRFFTVLRTGTEVNLEQRLVSWISEWETQSGLLRFDAPATGFHTIATASNGDIAAGHDDGRVTRWSKESDAPDAAWVESELVRSSGSIRSLSVNTNNALVAVGDDGLARIWQRGWTTAPVTLGSPEENAWIVTAQDGRFDFSESDRLEGFRWVMPDDPFRTLSPDIFIRDYYEPRLLARVLSGEKLAEVPSLVDLNRAQPAVRIMGIERERADGGGAGDTVRVAVEVSGASEVFGLEGHQRRMQSGVYDLRLFRDGQLVGQCPGEVLGLCPLRTLTPEAGGSSSEGELAQWRRQRQLVSLEAGKQTVVFTGIRLPRLAEMKEVQFSAYAFNEDRVKGETDRKSYEIPSDLQPRVPRAYIVSIGVNGFGTASWNLGYAVNDAKEVGRVLRSHLEALGQFTQVVWVPLISEATGQPVTQATKEQIKAVLTTLAGQTADKKVLSGIPRAKDLERARPEDLVVITISTHGLVDKEGGVFYFLPADIGADFQATVEQLPRTVSSDELSQWLRGLDALNQVMIVDACHSAASVQSGYFKPAPMGSRGLGQLAFDQGMRILTATQVDQDAIEAEKIKMGLLTYALFHQGLERGKADYAPKDGRIMLSEWLGYGRDQVPRIFKNLQEGTLRGRRGAGIIYVPTDKDADSAVRSSNQRPSLFDFARGRDVQVSEVSQ